MHNHIIQHWKDRNPFGLIYPTEWWIYGIYVIVPSFISVLCNNNDYSWRVHFKNMSQFIDLFGFPLCLKVRWNRYTRSIWNQHSTWFINMHSHNWYEHNSYAWNSYARELIIKSNCCETAAWTWFTHWAFLIWSGMKFQTFVPCIFTLNFQTSILP